MNLSCREVLERHFATNIQKWFEEDFELFGIETEQILVVSVDSAADIKKAVQDIITKLNEKVAALLAPDDDDNNIEPPTPSDFGADADAIEELSSIDDNAAKFEQLLAEGLKQPITQVDTRWSSVHAMLGRLLELKDFCQKLETQKTFEDLKISAADWVKVQKLYDVLKVPSRLTTAVQAEHLLVPDFVFHWHQATFELQKMAPTSSYAKRLLAAMKSKDREGKMFQNKAINAGWYLDKNLFLLQMIAEDAEVRKREARKTVRMVHEKRNILLRKPEPQNENHPDEAETEEGGNGENETSTEDSSLDGLLKSLGTKAASADNKIAGTHTRTDALEKELDLYEKFGVPSSRGDVLKWWCNHREDFPLMSPIAIDIISGPVTEVTIERLFSHLKIILNKYRSSLGGDLINDVLFLRMNNILEM